MKKIIALFFVTLLIFSCRNDETSNNSNNESSIIGKWSLQKVDVVMSSNSQTQTTVNSDCNKKTIHEFSETHIISTFYGIVNKVCQLTGEVNSIKYTFDKPNMKFWYENEQDYPYYIIKLTQNELIFEDRTQDRDGDNKPDILRRYFTKIN
ncbi:MAG: lipocalin family protein [Cloacibacterium sp.]|jgi:hypothetical protein|nr:lipocalin family protein [Cloacibacterium sp.]